MCRPIGASSRTADTGDKHRDKHRKDPDTDRSGGGPGSSHQGGGHGHAHRESSHSVPGAPTDSSKSRVPGGGGERDSHHSHGAQSTGERCGR